MKHFLLLICVSITSFSIGGFVVFKHLKSEQHPIGTNSYVVSPVTGTCPTLDELIGKKTEFVVVSVPDDYECYLGKDKITLAEIPERVRSLLWNDPSGERIVFVKAAQNVKYGTLHSIVEKIREAAVDRIELLPRKKRSQ